MKIVKFISVSLTAFCLSLSARVFATINYALGSNYGVDYYFPVNEPIMFTNFFVWTVNSTCVVTQSDGENVLSIVGIKSSGTVNNLKIEAGDTLDIAVHKNDVLVIKGPSGVRVQLTNKGNSTVTANCAFI